MQSLALEESESTVMFLHIKNLLWKKKRPSFTKKPSEFIGLDV